jgi:hypothetical protein
MKKKSISHCFSNIRDYSVQHKESGASLELGSSGIYIQKMLTTKCFGQFSILVYSLTITSNLALQQS